MVAEREQNASVLVFFQGHVDHAGLIQKYIRMSWMSILHKIRAGKEFQVGRSGEKPVFGFHGFDLRSEEPDIVM